MKHKSTFNCLNGISDVKGCVYYWYKKCIVAVVLKLVRSVSLNYLQYLFPNSWNTHSSRTIWSISITVTYSYLLIETKRSDILPTKYSNAFCWNQILYLFGIWKNLPLWLQLTITNIIIDDGLAPGWRRRITWADDDPLTDKYICHQWPHFTNMD